MGSLKLPLTGPIYIDTNILIYSVERVPPYIATLSAFWRSVGARQLAVLTSELTALETLVGPMRAGDQALEASFRQALFTSPDLQLLPVTLSILEHAAKLRATYSALKTPDAIHAATALETHCAVMLTHDQAFRQIAGLNVMTLDELSTP